MSLEAGYNWQIKNYVLGLAADANWINSAHSSGTAYHDGDTVVAKSDIAVSKVDFLSTIRARLGYVVSDNILLYGTGGLAIVRFSGGWNDTDYPDAGNKTSDVQWAIGWAAGAGADYRLNERWFLRGEYLHVEAHADLVTFNIPESETYGQRNSLDQDMFRFGVYYKF